MWVEKYEIGDCGIGLIWLTAIIIYNIEHSTLNLISCKIDRYIKTKSRQDHYYSCQLSCSSCHRFATIFLLFYACLTVKGKNDKKEKKLVRIANCKICRKKAFVLNSSRGKWQWHDIFWTTAKKHLRFHHHHGIMVYTYLSSCMHSMQ